MSTETVRVTRGKLRLEWWLLLLAVGIVLTLMWFVVGNPTPRPQFAMTTQEHAEFLNMTNLQAQAHINADGWSCPSVTGASLGHFADSGAPHYRISCSDGARYVVFWSADSGRIRAVRP